ncbi:MAG: ABC transporter permease subunit, partial [Pseudomonadota bacterium]
MGAFVMGVLMNGVIRRYWQFGSPGASTAAEAPRYAARASLSWTLGAVVIAALAAVPLVTIAASAPTGGLRGLSQLADTILWRYIANTAALMALAGALATLIGTGTAWLVSACAFPGRRVFGWALVLPLAVPSYIAAYVYADLLDFSGPIQSTLRAVTGWGVEDYAFPSIRSLWGGALILALVLYPYIYLLARAAFETQSLTQFQAARSLGAGPSHAFRSVALPAARPAIAGGLALVLMEVLADFGLAEYFAIPTFSTGIFRSWLAMGDKDAAMGLAALMLIFVALLVGLEALTRKGRTDSRDGLAQREGASELVRLSPLAKLGAFVACALPVALGFAVPALHLGALAMEDTAIRAAAALTTYLSASVWLGLSVALVTSALALVLVFAKTRSQSPLLSGAVRLATLGYALPGALLAVGLLAPLGGFDQMI